MGAELTSIEPLRDVIGTKPLGIFSDIDGTLAPIVGDPAKSKVSPRAKELLTGLIACHVRIALVSGREIEAARRIVGLENVAYAGNHGLHVWLNGSEETSEAVLQYAGQAQKVLAEIGAIPHPGIEIEDKGPVLAFHYRNAARQKFAREAIMAAIERAPGAAAFGVFEGRKIIELRPPLDINKGTAIVRLAERLGVRSAIAIGDDLTDVDMFRGVEELRRQGMAGATVAVWSAEAPEGLLEATDFWVRGVEGVECLLDSALRALRD
ncbi:MAG TPA: trehalose-phosphatase [Dehalococcoidia bacterium]|nr:trehalose-phosphatase [Dehalococcoidia bacterium]